MRQYPQTAREPPCMPRDGTFAVSRYPTVKLPLRALYGAVRRLVTFAPKCQAYLTRAALPKNAYIGHAIFENAKVKMRYIGHRISKFCYIAYRIFLARNKKCVYSTWNFKFSSDGSGLSACRLQDCLCPVRFHFFPSCSSLSDGGRHITLANY